MNVFFSLFRNSTFSILTNVLNRLGNAFVFILIVQRLGVQQGGTYSLGVAYFFIGSRFASWGLDHLLTREVAKSRDKITDYFVSFLALRLLLSLIVILIFLLFIQIPHYESSTRLVLALMLISILPENVNNLCWATFAACEEFHFTSVSVFFGSFFQIVLGYLYLNAGYGIVTMAIIFFVNNCAAMVINLGFITRRYMQVWKKPQWVFIKENLPHVGPFIIISIFYILDNRLDTILLSFFTSEAEIGIYTAATSVILTISMLPQGYRVAVLPIMSRYHKFDAEALAILYRQSYKYLLMLGIPIAVGTFLLAADLIHLLYGDPLPESVLILKIMSVAITFTFLNVLNTRLLIVKNRQSTVAKFLILSTITNVLFNLIFIRYLGAISAGIAQTITSFLVFALNSFIVSRCFLLGNSWSYAIRFIIGSIAMGFVVWYLQTYNMWVQIMVGAMVYFLCIYLIGSFTWQEKQIVREFFFHH